MLEKLKSRKLWAAVIAAVITTVGGHLGLTPDQLTAINTVIAAYIVGQGIADAGVGRSQS